MDTFFQLLHQHLMLRLALSYWERLLLSLNFMNWPLLVLNYPSAASSLLSSFMELKRVRAWLWIKLWFKGMLWLVWCSVQTTTASSKQEMRLFYFCIIHVFPGAALLLPLKNFSIAFLTWLFGPRGLAFSLSSFSTHLPHFISSFLAFDLKWELYDFFSLKHLEAILGLLIGLTAIFLCLRE